MDKTNNLKVFKDIVKKYIILIVVITVAGAGAVGFREIKKAPQYSRAVVLGLDSGMLYEISSSTDELLDLDEVYENIGKDKELLESYKKYSGVSSIDAKGLENWAKSNLEIEQSTKNYNEVSVTATTGSKELSKALADAYFRGLDKAIEKVSKEAYAKKIDYYQKKIDVIENLAASELPDASKTGVYNEAIDDLADVKLKHDTYFSPLSVVESSDAVLTTGKKALLNYMFVAAAASFLAALFLVFIIDYARSFKK